MSKRVRYIKSPLVEVVYQVNFPPILTIEANTPFEFQDSVRSFFPEYQELTEQQNELLINAQNPQNKPIFNQRQTRKLHLFTSDDGKWKLTLAKNMLSLSSLSYDHWEEMFERFMSPIEALVRIYKPAYYNRIALRYIDAIERKKLGLEGVKWSELLNTHVCGCLSYSANDKTQIRVSKVEAEMLLDRVSVKVYSGLGNINHGNGNSPSEAFILDCDYFMTGKYGIDSLTTIATVIHNQSTSFFQDAITEKLHIAMEPVDLEIE